MKRYTESIFLSCENEECVHSYDVIRCFTTQQTAGRSVGPARHEGVHVVQVLLCAVHSAMAYRRWCVCRLLAGEGGKKD